MKQRLIFALTLALLLAGCAAGEAIPPIATIEPTPTRNSLERVTDPQTPAADTAPVLAPPMTQEEQRVLRDMLSSSPQFTSSPGDCSKILKTESWCSVIQDARQITRPEWVELFPQTKFFLVAAKSVGGETSTTHNLLAIEQNGQRYQAETFDSLLEVNQIVITDQNRELVAKAFALITLKDYLEEQIDFTDWQAGKWEGRHTFDHYLKAWTKIQGIEFWWWFTFEGSQLKFVTRDGISDYHIGNYIDVPFRTLPLPPLADYRFAPK